MVLAGELVPVTEARHRLRDLLNQLESGDVILVRRSRPAAVLVSPKRYENMLRRIDDLEDQCSVLHAQLNPGDRISWEQAKKELELE